MVQLESCRRLSQAGLSGSRLRFDVRGDRQQLFPLHEENARIG
jgi:hypothetical protein